MHLHRAHRMGRTPERSLTPLLVQAGMARTLGSVMAFLSIALLILGAYVLTEVLKHPLQAESTEIIGAAVMITLAATILFNLLQPRPNPHSPRRRRKAGAYPLPLDSKHPAVIDVPSVNLQTDLPFGNHLAEQPRSGD
jgi:hypothetical protein